MQLVYSVTQGIRIIIAPTVTVPPSIVNLSVENGSLRIFVFVQPVPLGIRVAQVVGVTSPAFVTGMYVS